MLAIHSTLFLLRGMIECWLCLHTNDRTPTASSDAIWGWVTMRCITAPPWVSTTPLEKPQHALELIRFGGNWGGGGASVLQHFHCHLCRSACPLPHGTQGRLNTSHMGTASLHWGGRAPLPSLLSYVPATHFSGQVLLGYMQTQGVG